MFVNGGPDVAGRARLGVDVALYVDPASYLRNGQVTSSLDPQSWQGSFGPAAIHQHLRIGIPSLLAISMGLTGVGSPFLIVGAVLSNIMAAVVLATLAVAWKLLPTTWLRIVAIAIVVTSYPLWHLLLEGQWPQLISAAFVTAGVAIITISPWRNQALGLKTKWPAALVLGLLGAALVLSYSEVLVLLALWALISAGALIACRHTQWLRNGVGIAIGAAAVAAIALAPWFIEYVRHIFSLSTANVGYNLPYTPLPQDMIGLGNVWGTPEAWMTGEFSVSQSARQNPIRDLLIAALIVLLAALGALWLQYSRKSVIGVSMFITLLISAIYFLGVQRSDYLWSKSYLTFVPILAIILVAGLAWLELRESLVAKLLARAAGITIVLITFVVFITGLQSFSETSRPLTNAMIAESQKLPVSCMVVSSPRGIDRNSERIISEQWRYVDYVYDYWLAAAFRDQGVLDSWTATPIQPGAAWTPKEKWCLIVDSASIPKMASAQIPTNAVSAVRIEVLEAKTAEAALREAAVKSNNDSH